MTSADSAQPDITLILDFQGVIKKGALSTVYSDEGIDAWLGRAWAETVEGVGGAGVRRMVEDARNTGVSASHEVAQRFPSGLERTIEYTTLRLGDEAGFIVIGRNLQVVEEIRSDLIAAQQAVVPDDATSRAGEARYRLSSDTSNEPVLLVAADDLRVAESNGAARRSLNMRPGEPLLPRVSARQRSRVQEMLGVVRACGTAPAIVVQLASGRRRWQLRASLITSLGARSAFLLRFAPVAVGPRRHGDPTTAADLFERLSDGFVLIDQHGVILRANRPFRDLIRATVEDEANGQSLGRWLDRPGSDLSVLLSNLDRDGVVRLFPATMSRGSGRTIEVEISAAGSLTINPKFFGVLLRRGKSAGDDRAPPAAPHQAVDRAVLRKLIRNSIANFERDCIAAARDQSETDTATVGESGYNRKNPDGKLH